MTRDPAKGHSALRRGRWSHSDAGYFLTLCTEGKQPGLNASPVADGILREMHAMQSDGSWAVRCATIMPNHVHLLITLGRRLALARTLQRLKAKTSATLCVSGLTWERGFFDRQLRPDDDCLGVFLYLYLNPYRAGSVAKQEKWPYYFCCQNDWNWFSSYLEKDLPPPEWLSASLQTMRASPNY